MFHVEIIAVVHASCALKEMVEIGVMVIVTGVVTLVN